VKHSINTSEAQSRSLTAFEFSTSNLTHLIPSYVFHG